jgi:FAD/FMN-containing dehydrogenase
VPATAPLLAELAELVGADHVLIDPELRAGYEQDATGRFAGAASAVVRPADTGQVAAVVAACARVGAPVLTQGGNTGLSGGGVPSGGEVLLSLTRMQAVDEVDAGAGLLRAQAGASLAAVQAAARDAGLAFPVDIASRDTATIGGMIATNAAGASALRWGAMRAQVTGLEAVMADGTILSRMTTVPKDNAGYDWPALVIGSEGTLAIVTAARLRMRRAPRERVAALVGLAGMPAALELLAALREHLGDALEAADFFDAVALGHVLSHHGLRHPLPAAHALYVVLTVGTDDGGLDLLAGALEDADPDAIAVAEESSDRTALWRYREAINESLRAQGVVHKFDIGLGHAALPRFVAEAPARLHAVDPSAEVVLYGHLGDGNVHVNVLGLPDDDHAADDAVLGLVGELGGSVNAEHGVGVAKRDYLHLTRSAAEIAAMRALKRAWDPAGILNPGRVLPDE